MVCFRLSGRVRYPTPVTRPRVLKLHYNRFFKTTQATCNCLFVASSEHMANLHTTCDLRVSVCAVMQYYRSFSFLIGRIYCNVVFDWL